MTENKISLGVFDDCSLVGSTDQMHNEDWLALRHVTSSPQHREEELRNSAKILVSFERKQYNILM